MVKKRKFFSFTSSIALMIATFVGLSSLPQTTTNNVYASENLASSYTTYSYHYNFVSVLPEYSYKDVYSTSNRTISNTFEQKHKFVDSYKGPTEYEATFKVTTGTSRSAKFSGEVPTSIIKSTLDISYSDSSSTEVQKKFTFPGDNKMHELYVTRRHIDQEGYSTRTSYIAYPESYKYLWGIRSWDVVWGSYSRNSSRDISSHKSAAVTEYQYGSYMTP